MDEEEAALGAPDGAPESVGASQIVGGGSDAAGDAAATPPWATDGSGAAPAPARGGSEEAGDPFAGLFGGAAAGSAPAPSSALPQPYGDQGAGGAGPALPPGVDARLLNPDVVQAWKGALRAQYAPAYQAATTREQQAAIQERYAASIERIDAAVERAQAAIEVHQTRQMVAQQAEQLEPFYRRLFAQRLSQQYGVKLEQLLTDGRGQPINNPEVMIARAEVLGDGARQQRVQARNGADRLYSPAGGGGGSMAERLATMDPMSKEFADLERAVDEGRIKSFA